MTTDLLWRPERGVIQRVEYSTDIIVAHDGTEQRIARRTKPRQTLQARLFFDTDAAVQEVRGKLLQGANDAWWRIPLWWDGHVITSAITTGNVTLVSDFSETSFVAGDVVVLIDAVTEDYHVDVVDTTDPASIDLVTGVSRDFPAGSEVLLFPNFRLSPQQGVQRLASGQEALSLIADRSAPAALSGAGASVTTYQATGDATAKQLLGKAPLAQAAVGYQWLTGIERFDTGNAFGQWTRWGESRNTEKRTYRINTRADLRWWEKFITDCVGMREPFYTPTYRDDLTLTEQPSSGASVIKVNTSVGAAFDYETDWHPYRYENLWLATDAGDVAREVLSISDNGDGTSNLTLDSALAAGDGSVINRISFLEHVRLAADVVTFTHDGWRSMVEIAVTTAPDA